MFDRMANSDRTTDPELGIRVKVQPKASRNEVVGLQDGVLRVKVTAPPEKGKANDALVELLSDTFGVAKTRVEILSGHFSRNKLVAMGGLSADDLDRRLGKNSFR